MEEDQIDVEMLTPPSSPAQTEPLSPVSESTSPMKEQEVLVEQQNPTMEKITPPSTAQTELMSPVSERTPAIKQQAVVKQQNPAPRRGLWGIGRLKTFMIVTLYLLLIGALAFFIREWLRIPGLNKQVDQLEGEINRLETQNGIYADLYDELNATSIALNMSVVDLISQVNSLEDKNQNLTSLNGIYVSRNVALEATTKELNTSVNELTGEVNHLEYENQNLTTVNSMYLNRNQELETLSKRLNSSVNELTIEVDDLEVIVQNLTAQNQIYKGLNEKLTDTSNQLNASVAAPPRDPVHFTLRHLPKPHSLYPWFEKTPSLITSPLV